MGKKSWPLDNIWFVVRTAILVGVTIPFSVFFGVPFQAKPGAIMSA